jgi:hypothetical protein
MAVSTRCQTPGAVFHTTIKPKLVAVSVDTPFALPLTEAEAVLLESNLHNAFELVLSRYFTRHPEDAH